MTIHIHIQGLVQGVGFRPLVYRLANAHQLKGYVCNGNDGVHIYINTGFESAIAFVEEIKRAAPPLSVIEKTGIGIAENIVFTSFDIRESTTAADPGIPLTPDYALCEDCRNEMNDKNDRRYQYPFITCTTCGPRYSITESLPFDRAHTSMKAFEMCEQCLEEYNLPADRRYYAQTNSCSLCGVQTTLYDSHKTLLAKGNTSVISRAVTLLHDGKIISVKGIGGYLLMTDATNAASVDQLRKRKSRPHKPFAVLFPSVDYAKQYVHLSESAERLLHSQESPVVIAPILQRSSHRVLAIHEIAPSLDALGVMIPYAPLLQIVSNTFGKPLIATSANFSGSPVIYTDNEALNRLSDIADAILIHNRRILVPQDDSVVSFNHSPHPVVLRRSRGMAPSYFQYKTKTHHTVLATGALMKSSFTVSNKQSVYISQYLGSTDNYEAQLSYTHTLDHVLKVLKTIPEYLITDKHPSYFSKQLAHDLSLQYNASLFQVQHHKAHFAAVLAENKLLNSNHLLGVIWDGTGLGDDGQIWGSEFFIYANKGMQRCAHFGYFKNILHDKTAREPKLAALCIAGNSGLVLELLKQKFSDREWKLYNSMLQQGQYMLSSSMGRLFDAVACLLQLCDEQTYEGQAAMLLENAAAAYIQKHGYENISTWQYANNSEELSPSLLLQAVAGDIINGRDTGYIAATFHYTLVSCIEYIAKKQNAKKIAFSGGVFQNGLLCRMIALGLEGNYQLYFHKQLSPNDENISFGQLVYWDHKIDEQEHAGQQKIEKSLNI
ncbi:MAG: carbamoyltransferase HypF [Chitinophagaceae bacterium]|nr:carbamoyltransferase HypF [Chitinophagaceae bacterium]